jgi:hypothetical protein
LLAVIGEAQLTTGGIPMVHKKTKNILKGAAIRIYQPFLIEMKATLITWV